MTDHDPERPVVFDDDNPEWTEEDFRKARPAAEVLSPAELEGLVRKRGRQKAPTKQQVTIRLSQEVIAHFKRGGKGWQTRIDEALKRVVGGRS